MKCTKCLKEKPIDQFSKDRHKKTGRKSWCKDCSNEHMKKYKRTLKGVVVTIYNHQNRKLDPKNHRKKIKKVLYTMDELYDFLVTDKKFIELYEKWVSSGYDKNKKPSIDRVDFNEHYSFDNIQILTWEENNMKGNLEISKENNWKSRDKKSYETIPTTRSNFKVTCKTRGWDFDSFTEIETKEFTKSNKKFLYFQVD